MSRPTLRVMDGLREQAEEAVLEVDALRAEALAHLRRSRMAMQSRFWTDPEFAYMTRPLVREMERYERQIAGSGEAA